MVGALVRITVILAIAAGLTALGEILRRRLGRAPYSEEPVDLYEVAYLAGSTQRVALVATVTMIESGRLRLINGRLELVPDRGPPADGTERRVWHLIEGRHLTTVGDVGRGLDASDLRAALVRRGWLMTSAQQWLVRTVTWGLALVLVLVGLTVDPGQDVAVLMLMLVLPLAWFSSVERSGAGSAELRGIHAAAPILRVALHGTRALTDRRWRRAIERSAKQRGSATDWDPIITGP